MTKEEFAALNRDLATGRFTSVVLYNDFANLFMAGQRWLPPPPPPLDSIVSRGQACALHDARVVSRIIAQMRKLRPAPPGGDYGVPTMAISLRDHDHERLRLYFANVPSARARTYIIWNGARQNVYGLEIYNIQKIGQSHCGPDWLGGP